VCECVSVCLSVGLSLYLSIVSIVVILCCQVIPKIYMIGIAYKILILHTLLNGCS